MKIDKDIIFRCVASIVFMMIAAVGCTTTDHDTHSEDEHHHEHHEHGDAEALTLPTLSAAELDGRPLKVVASTSIIGDIVAQVGGDAIDLTTLMDAEQDPHSYEPGARDLTAVAEADVVFVNGWDLEEGLVHDLENIADVSVLPISANIDPEDGDPHVWFSVDHVQQWVENAEHVLHHLDPANEAVYEGNAAAYSAQLDDLKTYAADQFAQLAEDNRDLVTNHDSFGYLAHDYDLTILGTVIPSNSTISEPSASDLADLIEVMNEHELCTIFTETTVSDALAQTVAAELAGCDDVQLQTLYTGAVGQSGSYIDMFKSNVDTIVAGLQ